MTSLLIIAVALFAWWAWSIWARDGSAAFMREWSYVPLLGSLACAAMAIGLWLR